MVDRVLKYEELNEQLLGVAGQLGLPFEGLRARAKGGLAKGPDVVVTPAQRERIYAAFAPTLRFTGYRI